MCLTSSALDATGVVMMKEAACATAAADSPGGASEGLLISHTLLVQGKVGPADTREDRDLKVRHAFRLLGHWIQLEAYTQIQAPRHIRWRCVDLLGVRDTTRTLLRGGCVSGVFLGGGLCERYSYEHALF